MHACEIQRPLCVKRSSGRAAAKASSVSVKRICTAQNCTARTKHTMTFTFRQSAALARVLLVARPSRRPLVTMEAPPPPAGLPYGELARTLDAVEAEPCLLYTSPSPRDS